MPARKRHLKGSSLKVCESQGLTELSLEVFREREDGKHREESGSWLRKEQ